MDLSVSVPHPHATLLLSPSASMPMTVTVIAVVTVVVKVAVPHFKKNHPTELEALEPLPAVVTSVKCFSFAGPLDPRRL